MENILGLHRKNGIAEIEDVLTKVSSAFLTNDKIIQKQEDNDRKIIEISKEVTDLKDELESEKLLLEKKVLEYKEFLDSLEKIKQDKIALSLEVQELESKFKNKKNNKHALRDILLIESGRRKLELYRQFTCVYWDYTAPETVVGGRINNKKDFIKEIFFKDDVSYKIIRESIWKDIQKSYVSTLNFTKPGEDEENFYEKNNSH